MMSTRSTHACSSGFSVVELLVALTVTSIIAGAVMTLAFSSRDVFETDKHRTTINQNLRSGIDLLGIDVRQAGERLPGDAPAIEIINGASGAPDTLILRRNLINEVLPVCKNIGAGSSADSIFVARKNPSGIFPPGCSPVGDANGDGWPDNLEAWRRYRIEHGGNVMAYVHNPTTQVGEFFFYDDEDNSTFHIHKYNGDAWQYDYDVVDNARVYILEQRRFFVEEDVLKCVINEDLANTLNFVSHIRNFQCNAVFQDGTIQASMIPADGWSNLESIEVMLVGESSWKNRTMDRTLVTRFFPRNVLSN
jgi:type IV pilus assembly protein PilW